MDSTAEARLARAYTSLVGLWVGDAIGGFFEGASFGMARGYFDGRQRLPLMWSYTDDTNMALSIYNALRQHGTIDQDWLAQDFARRFERKRGYGLGARGLLKHIQEGANWREASQALFDGGSFGNGGAMRAAPLGAYFADDLTQCVEHARHSAEITHAHPEGVAGGIAAAVAAAFACRYREQESRPSRMAFIDAVLPYVPEGAVADGLVKARDTTLGFSDLEAVVDLLGHGARVAARDTVPLALWCAGEALEDYELAIRQVLIAGGDADTTAAITGGIVACYVGEMGVPISWQTCAEPMPRWAFEGNE